jgi:hypothetical protein
MFTKAVNRGVGLCSSLKQVFAVTVANTYKMSIEGVYELADVEKGKVSLRIKADGDGKWRVQAKVANNMNCVVTEENGVFTPGRVMSTKMMPVPEMEELENHISKLISGLTNITKEGKEDVSFLGEPIILFLF